MVPRPRVLVSTDIGGTDPDDFQSMVHFLLYADMFDVEGLVSSPYGPGRREHILEVIDHYAGLPEPEDHSDALPGARRAAGDHQAGRNRSARPAGFSRADRRAPTGSSAPRAATIRGRSGCSSGAASTTSRRRCTTRPTSCRSSASTSSADRTRCGASMPTTTSSSTIPTLWMIEANATYRGWFTGGNQSGDWGNTAFVTAHVAGRGALGGFLRARSSGARSRWATARRSAICCTARPTIRRSPDGAAGSCASGTDARRSSIA